MKLSVTCGLEEIASVDTFKEAWKEMYNWVMTKLNGEGLSHRLLETTCWIEGHPDWRGPMMFNDARDEACNLKLIVDGKLTY